MKRHLLLFLSLLVLYANADPVEIDGIYYNLIPKGKVAEVAKNPNTLSGSVVIPKEVIYDGAKYDVISIADYAFDSCSNLTSVTIPNSVTSIGDYAFMSCRSLTSITIPKSVTSIGYYAFDDCKGLTSVYISNIESWCNISFNDFYSNPLIYAKLLYLNGEEISNLVIPNSVTTIGVYAFAHYSGLKSVTIGNSVTSIGECAFASCSNLTSVTIPNSVTSIDKCAFQDCSNLTSVTIPNSVTTIGSGTFNYCSNLTSVTIPNSVTSIGDYAFARCRMTSITIPNSVTYISSYAFTECSSLASITIGSGVTSIDLLSFSQCPELTDVYCYAEKVPDTYSNAFEGSYIEYATLHVPHGCIDAYKSVEPWKSFKNIVEEEDTGINDIKNSATTKPFDVYDMSGRKVLTHVTSLDGLSNGVYIINGKKMIIK